MPRCRRPSRAARPGLQQERPSPRRYPDATRRQTSSQESPMNLSFSHAMITHDAARKIMDSAVNRYARANGWTVSVAVVDATGALVAAGRMDGSSPPILDFATDKAFTAATM